MTKIIIGIDEAGKGALAGPVTVAAAAFYAESPPLTIRYQTVRGEKTIQATDSKSYTNPVHRQLLDQAIRHEALAYSIVERSSKDIDTHLISNLIPEMMMLAAMRVFERLLARHSDLKDVKVMIDGSTGLPRPIPYPVECIVDGDKKIWQIGAASILAKVERDNYMDTLATRYPKYEFEIHKGYPTKAHKEKLVKYGACPAHRQTFAPVIAVKPRKRGVEY